MYSAAILIGAKPQPFDGRDKSAHVNVPRTERGYHPLCAVYSRPCLVAAARWLARGELELAPMFDQMRGRVVTYRAVEPNGMQS